MAVGRSGRFGWFWGHKLLARANLPPGALRGAGAPDSTCLHCCQPWAGAGGRTVQIPGAYHQPPFPLAPLRPHARPGVEWQSGPPIGAAGAADRGPQPRLTHAPTPATTLPPPRRMSTVAATPAATAPSKAPMSEVAEMFAQLSVDGEARRHAAAAGRGRAPPTPGSDPRMGCDAAPACTATRPHTQPHLVTQRHTGQRARARGMPGFAAGCVRHPSSCWAVLPTPCPP
jgi:hypothetical protein